MLPHLPKREEIFKCDGLNKAIYMLTLPYLRLGNHYQFSINFSFIFALIFKNKNFLLLQYQFILRGFKKQNILEFMKIIIFWKKRIKDCKGMPLPM